MDTITDTCDLCEEYATQQFEQGGECHTLCDACEEETRPEAGAHGSKLKVTLHLAIDQYIPEDKLLSIINKYVDELAKTGGDLTWGECYWTVVAAEEVSK